MNRKSQRGVALVITLLMLAMITIVAVLFLGIARRNRAGVSLKAAQTDAELATETAFQMAKADVLGQIQFRKQLLGYDLSVSRGFDLWSTNFIPLRAPRGDDSGPLVVTLKGGAKDSRFYLDLNRNGFYDSNTVSQVGDPEWIYVPDRPTTNHVRNNRFSYRYAYIALPVGMSLDANSLHNVTDDAAGDPGFLRNEGVGAWELNLAALLHTLDTNIWNYSYSLSPTPARSGAAFFNAAEFVQYRTRAPGFTPATLPDLFTNAFLLVTNGIDDLADDNPPGGILFGDEAIAATQDVLTNAYPGAEAARHYFTHQDFFDPLKLTNFVSNFTNAMGGTNGFKYYELLAQLGTDSGTERPDRLNLNYETVSTNGARELRSWDYDSVTAMRFFTNAAQRIFLSMSNDFNLSTNVLPIRSITEIPVYPTNLYSAAIHRVLQLAANIFDATRNDRYPSVFRPIVGPGPVAGVTYVVGYTNDNLRSTITTWLRDNTNGLPVIVGAKRGFPNFNEFSLRTEFLVGRKAQVSRPDTNSAPNVTNQVYYFGISNVFGAETWNSYMTNYPSVAGTSIIEVTNHLGVIVSNSFAPSFSFATNFTVSNLDVTNFNPGQFRLPLMASSNTVFNSRYRRDNTLDGVTNAFELPPSLDYPRLLVTVSNQLTYIHSENGRLIDCVVLKQKDEIDVFGEMMRLDTLGLWETNQYAGGPTDGLLNQLQISLGNNNISEADWATYLDSTPTQSRAMAIGKFRGFFKLPATPVYPSTPGTNLTQEAPFNPAMRFSYIRTWQANDPLVHYHDGDLKPFGTNNQTTLPVKPTFGLITVSNTISSLGATNDCYAPWGNGLRKAGDAYSWTPGLRDPGVFSSDNWDFPTNKMPSVGWLGRVHRATPWQTIYFKAFDTNLIGNNRPWFNQAHYLQNHPTNDWKLADIFTATLTDAAAKGLASINQPRVGTWAAVLGGVTVLSNSLPPGQVGLNRTREYAVFPILPSVTNGSPLMRIFEDITFARTNRPTRLFSSVGQILAVPSLTLDSPFLSSSNQNLFRFGIDDAAYERIPQQILGLLRIGESRFVIYSYGQALKPERINPSSGIVENYQVTAEFATRTVMRVEGTAQRPRAVVETFNILPPD